MRRVPSALQRSGLTESGPDLDASEKRRERFARLAAAMPFVIGLLATIVFVVGLEDNDRMRAYQGTKWHFGVLVTTWLSALTLGVTLRLTARGARVPAALSLGFAGLPWLVGTTGARIMTRAAIRGTSAAGFWTLDGGISEAAGARLLGGWCTSALALAVALGLAVAALGEKSVHRISRVRIAGVIVLTTPMLALAAYAGTSGLFGSCAIYGVVASVVAVVALALAGASVGAAPRAGVASLAGAVVPAVFVGILGAVAAMESGVFRGTVRATPWPSPPIATSLLLERADAFIAGGRVVGFATLALGLAIVSVGGWAMLRGRLTVGSVVRAGAMVVVALLVVGADLAASHGISKDVVAVSPEPWRRLRSFVPATMVRASEIGRRRPPMAMVTRDTILPLGGEPIALTSLKSQAGRDGLSEALRAARGRARAGTTEASYWPLRTATSTVQPCEIWRDGARRDRLPAMTFAIDARVPAEALKALFEAAHAANAGAVVLVGDGTAVPSETMARLEKEAPLIALLTRSVVTVTVLLEPVLPPGYAEADPLLWHATVTRVGEGRFTTRANTGRQARPVPAVGRRRWYGTSCVDYHYQPHSVAYLALADDATAGSLATFAEAAMLHGLQPLVVRGAVPGRPDQSLARE